METTGIPELRDIGVSGSVGGVSGVDPVPAPATNTISGPGKREGPPLRGLGFRVIRVWGLGLF